MSSRSLAEIAPLARAEGYDGLDINADRFERGPAPHLQPPLSAEHLVETKNSLKGLSTSRSALSANIYLVPEDPTAALSARAHVRSVIEMASHLGIGFVHVFTGRSPAAMARPRALQQLGEALADLCEYGRSRGVMLGIEGCVPHFVRSVAEHLELFRMMPGVNLRVCLDPSHMFLHGESPFEAIEALFDRISLVHVKDAAGRYPSFTLPPLGKGEMNWRALLGRLRSLGYDGDYAIEYEAAQFGWREDDVEIMRHGRLFLRDNGI